MSTKFGHSQKLAKVDTPIPPALISDPRCKICKCPQRGQVDIMLSTGWSQRAVMRWLNEIYGVDAFNPNNLSTHKNNHLSYEDTAIRRIIETQALQIGMDLEKVEDTIMTRDALMQATIQYTYNKMLKGEITPEVRDLMKGLELMDKMEKERAEVAVEELERDMRAFMAAVKRNVPESMWEQIYLDFEAELTRSRPMALTPAPSRDFDVDGKVVSESGNTEG